MSFTFTLVSNNSDFSEVYYPPIVLEKDKKYGLGLIGFYTYNSIPNIDKSYNTFTIGDKTIEIPVGSYELTNIVDYIKSQLGESGDKDEDGRGKIIEVFRANNNTLKTEIKSKLEIDLTAPNSIAGLLGFSPCKLSAGKLHESDLPVDIIKVSTIRVECNLVSAAYYGSKLQHTIYEFTPQVDPGYAINIEPRNIIYSPINTSVIDNIRIRLLDQDNKVVNFRGERIVVRLELKAL